MKHQISRRSFALSAGAAVATTPLFARATNISASASTGVPSDAFLARLPEIMDWANVPGLAIAVLKNGKTSWSRGFGIVKAGESTPVTTSTLFGAASLSKPVFAYAILRMRDEKLIDLDRPLWNYLPYEDLPAVDNSKLITARHVLSHSSGLQNWRFGQSLKLEFAFKPGEDFQYSGEGFYYLQRVLEQITGRGFEDYMQERVLKPLGMVNSTFHWTPAAGPKMSWGHNNRKQPFESYNAQRGPRQLELALEWKKTTWKHEDAERAHVSITKDPPPVPNYLLPNTAGSLITTIDEYSMFMTRLLAKKRRDDLDMSDATRTEMLTTQTKISSAVSWGVGVALENYNGRKMFWHWGDNGRYKALMMGEPASGDGVVVFANAQNGHKVWQRVLTETMGPDHPAGYFFMT